MPRLTKCLILSMAAACSSPSRDAANSGSAVTPLADSVFPDTPLGRAALRGRAILIATKDSLPGFVGNGLRCTTCHLDEGRRLFAMPWIGVHARYPQYRSRAGRVLTIVDRINECLERSLAGKSLPPDDDRLRAIESYFAFVSAGTGVGQPTPGQGIDSVHVTAADTANGGIVYGLHCARCHGANGDGAGDHTTPATPIWGPAAYTIGAGMARRLTAAAFIRRNMPFDKPGTLTEQQALDVAAYIDGQARPDFAGKERDWPKGNPPSDVPYKTTAPAKLSGESR